MIKLAGVALEFASIVRRLSLPANGAYSKAINWFCVVSRRTLLLAADLSTRRSNNSQGTNFSTA